MNDLDVRDRFSKAIAIDDQEMQVYRDIVHHHTTHINKEYNFNFSFNWSPTYNGDKGSMIGTLVVIGGVIYLLWVGTPFLGSFNSFVNHWF